MECVCIIHELYAGFFFFLIRNCSPVPENATNPSAVSSCARNNERLQLPHLACPPFLLFPPSSPLRPHIPLAPLVQVSTIWPSQTLAFPSCSCSWVYLSLCVETTKNKGERHKCLFSSLSLAFPQFLKQP